jgi:uncharacterized protein
METLEEQINQQLQLTDHGLEQVFADHAFQFDLRGGIIWSPAKSRVCLLTGDLLRGIYVGLREEAGPAWHAIFKNCGRIWGRRVALRLDKEVAHFIGRSVGQLPLQSYVKFITDYYRFHGWGLLELDLSRTLSQGLVEVQLGNSIFSTVVQDELTMADPMIAGMLGSMFSHLSGHDLDCVQTACVTRGADCSRFIITAAQRLQDVEALVQSGVAHQEIIEKL